MGTQEILDLLSSLPGEFVSGERISQQLKVTRASVWKQIKLIQEQGFQIEAHTKKGYRLLQTPLSPNEWVIKQMLDTRFLGQELLVAEELPSTNLTARELAQQGAPHGQAVLARRQQAGRGRMQRAWQSPEGGLWLSVVLRPNLPLQDASKLTLAASVALVDAFSELYHLQVGIKWPNDLVYNGRKIAGILGEVVGEWNSVQTLILGMGVNANFRREELSSDLKVVTLQEILGHEVDLNALAAAVLKQLEKQIRVLEDKNYDQLWDSWTSRAVGLGEKVRVLRGETVFQGVFRGISSTGELVLATEQGEQTFSAGEIQLRSEQGGYF